MSTVSPIRAALALSGIDELSSPEEVFRALAAQTPVGIFVASRSGELEYANGRWCELTGLAPEETLGNGWKRALHPDDAGRVEAAWHEATAATSDIVCEHRFLRDDGSEVRVETTATPLRSPSGEPIGWVGASYELSRERLRHTDPAGEERFRIAFEKAPVGMGLLGPAGDWIQVNPALCRLLGYSEEELLTLDLASLTVPGDATIQIDEAEETHTEARYLRADGTPLWVATSATLVRSELDEPLYHVVLIEDISSRKQTERELRRLADHDSLTGVLNRRGFMDGIRHELRRMERRGEYGALLLLDLDNFKAVNDTAGHMAGDRVLRATADVLRRRLRSTDVIGRLGGDEFAALVLNVTPQQASEIASETAETLRAMTVSADGRTVQVAASVGVIAIDEPQSGTEEELIAAADRAMYRMKSRRDA